MGLLGRFVAWGTICWLGCVGNMCRMGLLGCLGVLGSNCRLGCVGNMCCLGVLGMMCRVGVSVWLGCDRFGWIVVLLVGALNVWCVGCTKLGLCVGRV